MSDQIYFAAKYSHVFLQVRLHLSTDFVGNVIFGAIKISTVVLMSFSLSVCAAMSIDHFTG